MSDLDLETPKSDLKGRTVRGAGAVLVAQAIRFAARLVSIVVLARLLSPADFGLVAMIAPLSAGAMLLRDLGLGQAAIQRPDVKHGQLSNLFWFNILVTLSLAVAVAASAELVAAFYGEPKLIAIAQAFSGLIFFGGLTGMHSTLLTRQMRFHRIAVIDAASLTMGVAVGIIVALIHPNYWALIAMQMTTVCTAAVLSWTLSGWSPSLPQRQHPIWDMIKFGGNVAAFRFLNFVAGNVDRVLIGKVWGDVALGFYDRAFRLQQLPRAQINRPLMRVAVSLLSRLQAQPDRYRRAYQRILGAVFLATGPGMVFAMMTSDWLIPLILGEKWTPVSRLFAWLALASICRIFSTTIGYLYISQDRSDDLLRWGLVSSSGTIVSIVIGLPWGVIGVVVSYTLITVLLLVPFQLWWGLRRGPVGFGDVMEVVLPIALGLVISATMLHFAWAWTNTQPVVAPLVLFIATYLTCVCALLPFKSGRRTLRDIMELRHSFRTKRSEEASAFTGA